MNNPAGQEAAFLTALTLNNSPQDAAAIANLFWGVISRRLERGKAAVESHVSNGREIAKTKRVDAEFYQEFLRSRAIGHSNLVRVISEDPTGARHLLKVLQEGAGNTSSALPPGYEGI